MSYCELGLTQERMASSIRKQTIQSLVSSLGKFLRFLLSISSTSTNFFLSEAGLLTTGIVIRVLLTFFERLVFPAKRRIFIPALTLAKWLSTQLPMESRHDPCSLPFTLLTCHSFPDLILLMLNTKIMIMWSVFLSPWPTRNWLQIGFQNISPYYHGRRFSTSSSRTNNSRNTSPSPSLYSDSDSTPTEAWGSSTKLRLEPCPLEEASAVIFVPPEAHPLHPQTNWFSHQTKGKGLFLVGPALLQVRHPQRPLAKGARLHPYKIVHGSRTKSSTSSRRSSIISVTGLNSWMPNELSLFCSFDL